MGKLADIARKLKGLKMEESVLNSFRKNSPQIIDLNLAQLDSGKDSMGELLQPPYRDPGYAKMKLHLNPKGVVDLKLSGEFWEGFFIEAESFPISFMSTDLKTGKLVDKYGKQIFGLDETSLGTAKEIVLPEVREDFRKALHV